MSEADWKDAYILHDLIVERRHGWRFSGHRAIVTETTREAAAAFLRFSRSNHANLTDGSARTVQ